MSREKQTTKLSQNEALHIGGVMRFYFKVSNYKLDNYSLLQRQINNVVNRIKLKHSIKSENIEIKLGRIDDDFVYNRFRLRVSFNCA